MAEALDTALDVARRALEAQPFSRLLGTELTAWSATGVELRLVVRPDVLQQHGLIHGGVIAYLADNALAFAGGATLGPQVVTGEYNTSSIFCGPPAASC